MKSKTLFSLVVLTLFTSLIPAVYAQTFSVIHTFIQAQGFPRAGVTIQGNTLYGTTFNNSPAGTVYQLTHSGSNWIFSNLAILTPSYSPAARVVFGPDGHLYTTSFYGGAHGVGAVLKLTPGVGICKTAGCNWTVDDIHDFASGTDGAHPGVGDLIWDQQGNIYGTTAFGGQHNYGTVYELTPSGNGYTETVLYQFSGRDGLYPWGGVVRDNSGNLFGTTQDGGVNLNGNVFELTYVVGVGWTEQTIYSFQGASDGDMPFGGLIFDSAGNLYGTTSDGGSGAGGTVFELSPSGDTWTFKLLYSLTGQYGSGPQTALTMDAAGDLYGTTVAGGINNAGSVFKLTDTINGWVYTSLHDFTTDNGDGYFPYSSVSIDTDGTLYGTTAQGQGYGGTVWMIKP